jgi:hypothetical protein
MKASRKALLSFVLGAGLVVGLSLLALSLSGGGSTHAQGPIVLAIDMDPTGNSCPGDGVTDCTLGTIDRCVSVPATQGTTFDIDGVVKNLWNGHIGWNWDLAFPDSAGAAKLTLTAEILQNSAVNLIMQSAGSTPIFDGDNVPDATSPHGANMLDFGTAETTPPFTKGVESRMTFTVGAGATPGLYSFSIVPGTYAVADVFATNYAAVKVLDSEDDCAVLALGVACPQVGACPDPVGGIAELPDVAGSSGPPYAALAGLAAAALAAFAAGAWYARRRWVR